MFLPVAEILRSMRRPQNPPATGLRPGDDGPDPDNAARAARAMHAAARVADVHPEDSPPGRPIRAVPRDAHGAARPKPPVVAADGCPGCAGRERVIRELEAERAQLRKRVAQRELGAPRSQWLGRPEQLH